MSVAATQENTTISYEVKVSATSGTMEGAAISIITFGALELEAVLEFVLDLEASDELFDDTWLELEELISTVELTDELSLLSVLLVTLLASEEV